MASDRVATWVNSLAIFLATAIAGLSIINNPIATRSEHFLVSLSIAQYCRALLKIPEYCWLNIAELEELLDSSGLK